MEAAQKLAAPKSNLLPGEGGLVLLLMSTAI